MPVIPHLPNPLRRNALPRDRRCRRSDQRRLRRLSRSHRLPTAAPVATQRERRRTQRRKPRMYFEQRLLPQQRLGQPRQMLAQQRGQLAHQQGAVRCSVRHGRPIGDQPIGRLPQQPLGHLQPAPEHAPLPAPTSAKRHRQHREATQHKRAAMGHRFTRIEQRRLELPQRRHERAPLRVGGRDLDDPRVTPAPERRQRRCDASLLQLRNQPQQPAAQLRNQPGCLETVERVDHLLHCQRQRLAQLRQHHRQPPDRALLRGAGAVQRQQHLGVPGPGQMQLERAPLPGHHHRGQPAPLQVAHRLRIALQPGQQRLVGQPRAVALVAETEHDGSLQRAAGEPSRRLLPGRTLQPTHQVVTPATRHLNRQRRPLRHGAPTRARFPLALRSPVQGAIAPATRRAPTRRHLTGSALVRHLDCCILPGILIP